MSKFKKGDYVRIIDGSYGHSIAIGTIGVISSDVINETGPYTSMRVTGYMWDGTEVTQWVDINHLHHIKNARRPTYKLF